MESAPVPRRARLEGSGVGALGEMTWGAGLAL